MIEVRMLQKTLGGGLVKRAARLLSGIVGAMLILAIACGGAAPGETPADTPTEIATTAPTEPAATTAPAETPAETPAGTPPAGGDGGGDQGMTIAQNSGCSACHSTDGSTLVGPTWQGLFGSEVTLTDGSTVTADEEYLRESIVDPNAKVVEGFQPNIMPQNFGETLSDSNIEAVIAYIQSLQ
jgi:cytochrome c oxidase subunit 2